MASDIETVIEHSKAIEQILSERFGATGRGLHEKANSVANQLDEPTIKTLRWIATMRNKVVHENFSLPNQNDFINSAQRVCEKLQSMPVQPTFQPYPTNKIRRGTSRAAPTQHHVRQPRSQPQSRQAKSSASLWPILILISIAVWYWFQNK